MRIAMAQINSYLGDFAGNAKKILEFTHRAKQQSCDLVVFPELSLFGYWTADLLERASIVDLQLHELERLQKALPTGIAILVGAVTKAGKREAKYYRNSAVLLQQGKKPRFFHKELLPNYEVFDEQRHFVPGKLASNTFRFKGKKILVSICEDIWAWGEAWQGTRYHYNPFKDLERGSVDLIVNLSASPYSRDKHTRRLRVVEQTAKYLQAPMLYVNCVGGQDELVFDGGSFAVDAKAQVMAKCISFDEDLCSLDFFASPSAGGSIRKPLNHKSAWLEEHRQAIALAIRDFTRKNSLARVHLGLSGGIDSALVACLAVDALGPGRVTCIAMPGPFNAEESLALAKQLSQNLNCQFHVLPIESSYQQMLKDFEECFGKADFGLTNENLQARIRGSFLMAYANRYSSLLLATGNKSEFATGYSTLYGDMNGGLAPIGDLLKTEVRALAQHYNQDHELIPQRIIDRPPSAELRPEQTDQQSLPPYQKLDQSIERIVVGCEAAKSKIDRQLLKLLFASEFKRWQAPPIVRVSQHAFGTGRRFPITHAARV